jgi:hypothetical protein
MVWSTVPNCCHPSHSPLSLPLPVVRALSLTRVLRGERALSPCPDYAVIFSSPFDAATAPSKPSRSGALFFFLFKKQILRVDVYPSERKTSVRSRTNSPASRGTVRPPCDDTAHVTAMRLPQKIRACARRDTGSREWTDGSPLPPSVSDAALPTSPSPYRSPSGRHTPPSCPLPRGVQQPHIQATASSTRSRAGGR